MWSSQSNVYDSARMLKSNMSGQKAWITVKKMTQCISLSGLHPVTGRNLRMNDGRDKRLLIEQIKGSICVSEQNTTE